MRRIVYVLICFVVAVGCRETLYHDLDEAAANEIVATLQRSGVPATKVSRSRNKFGVEIPPADHARSVHLLKKAGVPRPPVLGIEAAYPADQLLRSPTAEHAVLQHATGQEVRRALLTLTGVSEANVQLTLPRTRRDPPPTASVVVRWVADAERVEADAIARFVASATPQLTADRVEVLMTMVAPPTHEAVELVQFGPLTIPTDQEEYAKLTLFSAVSAATFVGLLTVAAALRRRRNY